MNWLHYLLEANIYLGVFYALYYLFFNKETYYKLNRAYLLCTPVLSYLIPLVQIGWLKPNEDNGHVVATVIYNSQLHQNVAVTAPFFTLQNMLVYGYMAGAVVMLTVFIFKILQLVKLTRSQKSRLNNRYNLVKVEDTNTAFSFFNYVFIGTNVSGADTMIRHELVHIEQKHSLDIVFLELVKVVNWFNPFVYLVLRSLKTVHEYIADEHTARYENDVLTYSSFLVNNAYGLSGSSISNSFFNYNLLKKRIIMLNQKRSGNLARLKYLAVIPICMGLLCMSTLAFSKTYGWIKILPAKNSLVLQTPVTKKADTIVRLKLSKDKKITKNGDTIVFMKPSGDKNILPPPPPAPGKKGKSGDAVKITDVKLSPATPTVLTDNRQADKKVKIIEVKLLPPPPPPADPLDSFYKYVAKHIRYPKSGRDGHIAGKVILEFNVAGGKINNSKVVRGLSPDIDGEALRVLNDFSAKMNTSDGTYALPISFALYDKNNKLVERPQITNISVKPANSNPTSNISISTVRALNEIVVTSYVN